MVESQNDKSGGNPFNWKDQEYVHWSNFIRNKNLFDPLANSKDTHPGIWHTLCNFQQGHARIYSRLDRFYGNKDFISFLPDNNNVIVKVTATTLSDHHPIFTRINISSGPTRQKSVCSKFLVNTELLQDVDVLCAIHIIRNYNFFNLKEYSMIDKWKATLPDWKNFSQTIGQKYAKDFRFDEKNLNSNLQEVELKAQSDPSNLDFLN